MHEIDHLIEVQRLQPRIGRVHTFDAAMAIDTRRADIFGLPEKLFAAIRSNDAPQNGAQISDVGVLRDRHAICHAPIVRCTITFVNRLGTAY